MLKHVHKKYFEEGKIYEQYYFAFDLMFRITDLLKTKKHSLKIKLLSALLLSTQNNSKTIKQLYDNLIVLFFVRNIIHIF